MAKYILLASSQNITELDEREILELGELDCFLHHASDGDSLVAAVSNKKYDLILIDLDLPGREISELLSTLFNGNDMEEIVLFSVSGAPPVFFDVSRHLSGMKTTSRSKNREQSIMEIIRSKMRMDPLPESPFIGIRTRNLEMLDLLEIVGKTAVSDIPVHIQGESGTGKELIADMLHRESGRKKGNFISINCASIPENLFESELFGHEKGAFTGAHTMKRGLLEMACNGTFFIDEIAEMPLNLQSKLLRAVENGEFYRVGGTKKITVKARIVSASNKDLRALADRGEFREDLYWRLAGVVLEIPPLRERSEDLELLFDQFKNRNPEYAGKEKDRPESPGHPEETQLAGERQGAFQYAAPRAVPVTGGQTGPRGVEQIHRPRKGPPRRG